MRRLLLTPIILLPLTACVSSGVRDVEITPAASLDTKVGRELVLLLPAGDFTIEPSMDDELHATARFFCNSQSDTCREKAAEAGIVHALQGTTSTLSFKPSSAYTTRHADLRFLIQVPAVEQLDIEMDAGDLKIDAASGCLNVKAGAGDVSISAPASSVARVKLDANIGDASLRIPDGEVFDERKLLVGSEVLWEEGTGSCQLRGKLQAGDLNVRLTSD
ncbi:DUF4097 family beta strand repeat-containing protein [Congregibacter brevis]|uniref:DUF4097 family beta strand repeat-containing protein n=1 Tax=Congregibacter brevis TaxID=3081201 RepID=A0ABZ0IDD0_9GAMM|nr:DUF4097 family beta strand repeat-containing protein [Congregibacter sp. IMCC45268]